MVDFALDSQLSLDDGWPAFSEKRFTAESPAQRRVDLDSLSLHSSVRTARPRPLLLPRT